MSLVYILTAFVAVLLNNLLVETLSLNTRINFGNIYCAILFANCIPFIDFSLHAGYAVSFITLLFVATCEIWWNIFGPELAYKANLIAVAVVALGCTGIQKACHTYICLVNFMTPDRIAIFTVQQSSFYGYTSMLPSRYTQAVMTGESEFLCHL